MRLFTWQDEADLTNWTTTNGSPTIETSPPTGMGTACLKIPGTATADWVRYTYTSKTKGSLFARAYFCFTGFAGYTTPASMLELYGGGYAVSIKLIQSTRKLRIDNAITGTYTDMSGEIAANTVYRLEYAVGISDTAGTGEFRLYEGEGASPLETLLIPGNGAVDTLAGTYSYVRVGNPSTINFSGNPWYINWVAVNDALGYTQTTWVGSDKTIPDPETEPIPEGQDIYGGYLGITVPGGATGRFRVAKRGDRWMYATPLGNAFIWRGVFYVAQDDHTSYTYSAPSNPNCDAHENVECPLSYRQTSVNIYGDAGTSWAAAQGRRIRSWGFNGLSEGADASMSPWGATPPPVKLARIPFYIEGASYSVLNKNDQLPNDNLSVKDIGIYGSGLTNSDVLDIGKLPDIYDPNYQTYIEGRLARQEFIDAAASPYLLGFSSDDTDYLRGFGACPSSIFQTSPTLNKAAPHIGWIVAAGRPTQTNIPVNANWPADMQGLAYASATVYSKQAWADWLEAKYTTIAALNAAWGGGANYSTFGSNGGWGVGDGILDENGKSAWFGAYSHALSNCTTGLATDLNAFLEVWATKYFQLYREAMNDAGFADVLFLGPTTIGAWGAPPRAEIIRAAALYADVIRVNIDWVASDALARLQYVIDNAGDKPVQSTVYLTANDDAMLYRHTDFAAGRFATQAERGAAYATILGTMLNAETGSGVHPVVGISWWQYTENYAEFQNFGLVSLRDNAYDGQEATIAGVVDTNSVPGMPIQRGGEERDYGDALTAITNANADVYTTITSVPVGTVRLSAR